MEIRRKAYSTVGQKNVLHGSTYSKGIQSIGDLDIIENMRGFVSPNLKTCSSIDAKEYLGFPCYVTKQRYKRESRLVKVYNPYKSIDLLGEKYLVHKAIGEITEEIEYSKFILKLKDGWNEDNAKQIDKGLWKKAVIFLIECAESIYNNNYSIVLIKPEINPCPDGTIDISWRFNHSRLVINVKKEDNYTIITYYGDRSKGKIPIISGSARIDSKNDTNPLIAWMSKQLT